MSDTGSVISGQVSRLFAFFGPAPDRVRLATYCDELAAFDPHDVRSTIDTIINTGAKYAFVPALPAVVAIARDVARKRREVQTLALPPGEPTPRESDDDRAAWKRLAIGYRESRGLSVPDWLREADVSRMRVVADPRAQYVAPLREDPYQRALREVHPDDLAGGYQPDPGIGARCRRLLQARQDAYLAHGVDRVLAAWAALNDLARDSQVGEHVRRLRAAQVRAARGNS